MESISKVFVLVAIVSCAAPRTESAPSPQTPQAAATAAAEEPSPDAGATAAPADDAAGCAARGGVMKPVCRMQKMTCVLTYEDGGKACSDKKDCTGECIYEGDESAAKREPVTGVCQRTSDPCGCRARVSGGKVMTTICVD